MRFGPDVLKNGLDPLSFIRYLQTLGRIADYIRLIEQQGEAARLGEMLLNCGTLTAQELDRAINVQADNPGQLIGAILVDAGVVQPEVVEPPPTFGAKIRSDFIEGIAKVNGKFVILLNVQQVLSRSEIGAMGQAAASAEAVLIAA